MPDPTNNTTPEQQPRPQRSSAPVPVNTSLPDDNFSRRIGLAAVISVFANVMLLQGAASLAESMTVTRVDIPQVIELITLPKAASPTPTPTPTPEAAEPTPGADANAGTGAHSTDTGSKAHAYSGSSANASTGTAHPDACSSADAPSGAAHPGADSGARADTGADADREAGSRRCG